MKRESFCSRRSPQLRLAADFNGYIIDESCASKPAMKGNEACARKCIKGGSPAVLLTADAKVYKLDDQAKVSGTRRPQGQNYGQH